MQNPINESMRFRRELDVWVRDGIITAEQSAEIRARYKLASAEPGGRFSLILKAAAALLTGMGMFLLISANWHRIELAGRMGMGLLPLLGTYGAGMFFLTRKRFATAGTWFLLSSILLGVNIFLQAQIFHLSGYLPHAFLWWMLGSVPAAMYFRTAGHNALLQLVYLAWVGGEAWYGKFTPAGLIIPVVSGLLVYRTADKAMDPERDRAPGRFTLVLMAFNFICTLIALDRAWAPETYRWFSWSFPALAGVFTLFALLHLWRNASVQHFLDRMRGLTAMIIALSLLVFSVAGPARTLMSIRPSVVCLGAIPVAFAILGLVWFQEPSSRARKAFVTLAAWPAGIMVFLTALNLILVPVIRGMDYPVFPEKSLTTAVSILSSTLLLSYALTLVFHGIRGGAKRPFMTGIFLIIALAMVRYLEYFNDYVLAAAMFIFCGILLVTLNIAWEKMNIAEEKNAREH